MRQSKWLAGLVTTLGIAMVLVSIFVTGQISNAQDGIEYPEEIPFASDSDDPVERGAYLAWAEIGCAHCHAGEVPADGTLFDAAPSGGNAFDLEAFGYEGVLVYASNLTNLQEWSDQEIEDSIRYGVRPDGTVMVQPMAYESHQFMSDADMEATIAWIRSFETVENEIPEIVLPDGLTRADMRPHAEILEDMPVDYPEGMEDDAVVRGEYLARYTTHCTWCHGAQLEDVDALVPDVNAVPNGTAFEYPSLGQENLIFWSDDNLRAIIQQGIHEPQGGRDIVIMPWYSYQYMDQEDVDAIIAWLRTLP